MGYSDPYAPPAPPDYTPYPGAAPPPPPPPAYAPDPYASNSPPVPPPAYPPAGPPHPAHHGPARRRAALAVVAILALVAVVVLLNLAGVLNVPFLPGSTTNPGGPGGPTPLGFHAAEKVANATTSNRGGSWSLIYANGAEFSHSANYPALNPCQTYKGFVGGAPSSLGTGTATAWVMIYETVPITAWSHLLILTVYNGSAHVTVQEDPVGDCMGGSSHPGIYPLPGNVSDSLWAAAVANARGGSTFLAQYPNASVSLSLNTIFTYVGGVPVYRAQWTFAYLSSCSGTATGTTASFQAVLNATNATMTSHRWQNATCSQTPVPAAAVAFGPATVSHAGLSGAETFYENLTVQANRDVSTANFSLSVLQANGTLVNAAVIPCFPAITILSCESAVQSGGWFALINSGTQGPVGALPAIYATSGIWATVTGGTLALTSDVSLTIISPTSLSGDTLEGFGYGANVVPAATVTLA